MLWVREYTQFWRLKAAVGIWSISAVLADITITVTMSYYLRCFKGNVKATDRLLDRIIRRKLALAVFTPLVMIYIF